MPQGEVKVGYRCFRLALAWVLVSSGCACIGQTTPQPRKGGSLASGAQAQEDALKKRIDELQVKVSKLEKDNLELSTRVFSLELKQDAYRSIALDLSSRQYLRIDTETGSFFISVQDASPYLDGYRIKLDIGNPYYANYKGFKLTVTWNSSIDSIKDLGWQKWKEHERTKEVPFTETLQPGSWTRIELLLPATSGGQLGYLTLAMTTDTVSLLAH
jgi:hypothetical protein